TEPSRKFASDAAQVGRWSPADVWREPRSVIRAVPSAGALTERNWGPAALVNAPAPANLAEGPRPIGNRGRGLLRRHTVRLESPHRPSPIHERVRRDEAVAHLSAGAGGEPSRRCAEQCRRSQKARMTALLRAREMFSFACAIASSTRRSASGGAIPVLAAVSRMR